MVGGNSHKLILFNFADIALVELLKGDRIKGIQEKVMTEILYQVKLFTKSITDDLALVNLDGEISLAVIDKDTSNNI